MKYPSFCLSKKTKEILPCGREKTIKTWLQGAGGMLRAKIWLPALETGEKCPMVIVMHGIMTTKDIYPQPEIAKRLQSRGIAALCAGELAGRIAAVVLMAPAAVCKDDALNGRIMGAEFDPVSPPETLKVMMHSLGRNYIMVAQGIDIYGKVSAYGGPVCIIHGEKDSTVPVQYGERFKESCPQAELHILPDEGHLLNGNKEEVCSIVTGFLEKYLK